MPALAGSTAQPAYSLTAYNHKAESGAAFGSATFDFTDALKLTVGARWTRETKTLDFDRLASPNAAATGWSSYTHWWDSYTGTFGGPGTFSDDLKRTWNAFTYDVTPSWKIDAKQPRLLQILARPEIGRVQHGRDPAGGADRRRAREAGRLRDRLQVAMVRRQADVQRHRLPLCL